MGSHTEIEDGFFDTREVFAQMSDSGSECSSDDCSTSGFGFDYWAGNLGSVDERRSRFLRSMGLSSNQVETDEENEQENDEFNGAFTSKCVIEDEENKDSDPTMLQNPDFQDQLLIRQPSLSCWSNNAIEFPSVKTGNQDDSYEDASTKNSFDVGSSSQQKETENLTLFDRRTKVKKSWLQKLNIMARTTDHQQETSISNPSGTHAVHVHTHKKKSKELSSLYTTQDFPAHKGSISVLKFSHDGRYLASAGDDGIVRIWDVSEDEDPRKYGLQEKDPSSFYFSSNRLSELAPLKADKEKTRKITGLRKPSDFACVILPPKVFRILERPVHEFHGHGGEILSLSWSKKGYLLSSSVDKTVRMWRVGDNECLKVFTHNNYVTCVEFNPVDENYFISGSIDGKIRIWGVGGCQVIDWIDIREIVTAVCYYPNGKGSIVGTLDGNCSFYNIIDNRIHLDTHISLMSKKKWPRRVTGFQFCPTDTRKVIVSSADSQVRIICGINIVGKFKGNRSSGSQISASFTSDGKHIVSTGDDSNVYIWNDISSDKLYTKPKSNISFEHFPSQNASVAIPWCGMKTLAAAFPSPRLTTNNVRPRSTIDSPRTPSSFLDSLLSKSPATWPAETLPDSTTQVSVSPSMRKSEYRFLKSAYQRTFVGPHTWGLVIVSAGFDGRIRTYLNYGLPIQR